MAYVRSGATVLLSPAIAHGIGHPVAPVFVSGQAGIGGHATIGVLAGPCLTVAASGHGSGRQMIAAEVPPATGLAHGMGGHLTPVSPDGPLAPAAAPVA